MKQIALSGGKAYALVDDEDYEWLSPLYTWTITNMGYAQLHKTGKFGQLGLLMHRLIMFAESNQQIDHIDGNPLNNQKANLRFCDAQGNNRNRKKTAGHHSQYKGVTRFRKSYWRASIGLNSKHLYLGDFKDEHTAALMYDFWAVYLFGTFAKTNFKTISFK
jgi:hypothetical protein